MKEYTLIKTENFPVIKVVFTGHKANDDNFRKYLDELTKIYSRKENLAIIFDTTKAVLPGLKHQRMQGDWLKENEELMKDYCVGTAYFITNTIIRSVLKTIFKFQNQPVPYIITGDIEEANKWVKHKLSQK